MINPNLRTLHVAAVHNLPMVGTSDTHFTEQFGTTYSLVDAKKTQEAVFAAIKAHKVKVHTKPLSHATCAKIFTKMQAEYYKYRFKRFLGLS